jgi:hypothetical protein
VILDLRNNLNKGANTNDDPCNDAQVVSSDNGSGAAARTALTFLESFDLLANNKSNSTGIGVQYVSRANHSLSFPTIVASPFKVGFVGSGNRVSAWGHPHGNRKVAFLGFQNQATSGFNVDNATDADLNKAKWICDANHVLSHFYAGFEKKDKNNPEHKQVQRQRAQEGSWSVDVKVETRNQGIDNNHRSSANQSGEGSVFEILHELSLTEEEVG